VRQMLLGVETEYALGGGRRKELLAALMSLVKEHMPSLEGANPNDRYLANGARFYVDSGLHPEWATPECTTPSDVVRHALAGDRFLSSLLERVPEELRRDRGAGLFKCNVDYSGAKTTWGSHESYLHRSFPAGLARQIIPHLVSRVIYAGAGGFNPLSAGFQFTLSPRSVHLEEEVSRSSTERRGIFHTKNESLAKKGYHRMHLLCGESLCSHVAGWLRVGATALVVAMIDAGLRPDTGVRLEAPLRALEAFVNDSTCRATAAREGAPPVSAVEIQRHYLQVAEENLSREWMPPWAEEVCVVWRDMLERIEHRPESLSSSLDWAIKLAVYREYAEQRGVRWRDFPAWTHVLEGIRTGLRASPHVGMARVELILGRRSEPSPIPDTIKSLTPYVESHELSWDMLRPVVDLRKELFELDFRFGQLGGSGVFDRLDRARVLQHRAPGVVDIGQAVRSAPRAGRAGLRARRVRMYAGREAFHCNWDSIWDAKDRRVLDLSDPFATQARWRKVSSERELARERLRRLVRAERTLFDVEVDHDRA
jgi:proteasome accessory factor A